MLSLYKITVCICYEESYSISFRIRMQFFLLYNTSLHGLQHRITLLQYEPLLKVSAYLYTTAVFFLSNYLSGTFNIMHFYLTQDIRKQVKRIADFLEVSLSDEDIEKVVHGSDFNTMKNNYEKNNNYKKCLNLFRKGTRSSWLFGKHFLALIKIFFRIVTT